MHHIYYNVNNETGYEVYENTLLSLKSFINLKL